MENAWITLAEVQVEPGDMSFGDTLGFLRVTMWALPRKTYYKNSFDILESTSGLSFRPKRLK
jgi:hypothetical protein